MKISAMPSMELLTSREKECLKLIAFGYTNNQIADVLYFSADTVKSHVTRILRKLNAKDRTNAVYIACKTEILNLKEDDKSR